MECGKQCYVLFAVSLIAVSLLITSMSTPYQLVFITKPFARIVLGNGLLDNWSAEKLDLDPGQFEMVKQNYHEYLQKSRRRGGGDDSDDSDDSSDSDGYLNIPMVGGDLRNSTNASEWSQLRRRIGGSDSSDSSDSVDGESSDSSDSDSDMTLAQRLENQPRQRTISFGLFSARICTISQNYEAECVASSVSESFDLLSDEVVFMEQEINLPIWNDIRVESLLSTAACCVGILFALVSFKPCCANKNAPVYLGSMFFAISGIMIFIPIVRILMISGDFREMLVSELNITTSLGFSWSVLAAGISVPFSVIAAILLVVSIWAKTKRIVKKLLKGGPQVSEGMHDGYKVLLKNDLDRQHGGDFGRRTDEYVDSKTDQV